MFNFSYQVVTVNSGNILVKHEVDAVGIEPLELLFIHCRERYALVLNLTFTTVVDYGCEIAEVSFEAAKHIVHAADVPPFNKRKRQVVVGQPDERKELLVKFVIAGLADTATHSRAYTQTLFQIVVAIVERNKTIRSYAAIDVHSFMQFEGLRATIERQAPRTSPGHGCKPHRHE